MTPDDVMGDPEAVEELLNAYLDDELGAHERARVEEALESDAQLRADLAAYRATRSVVRDLPLLEMPPGLADTLTAGSPLVVDRVRRTGSRTRTLALSAVASVAFWGVVATAGDATAVVPDLAGVVSAHASTVSEEEHDEGDPAVELTAPDAVDDFELVYKSRRAGVSHAMYTDGARQISVFEQRGRVDWDRVPTGGTFRELAGGTAWTGDVQGQSVMLIERRGMVYTFVASWEPDQTEMSEMSSAMPGDDDDWFDQVRRASRRTTDFFGLDS